MTDAAPKVLVPPADAAALLGLAWPSPVRPLALEASGGAVRVADGSRAAVDSLPVNLVAAVALSDTGETELSVLRDAVADRFGAALPATERIDLGGGPVVLAETIVRALVAAQRRDALQAAALTRELALVRASHGELQESFRALERFASANLKVGRARSDEFPPARQRVALASDDGAALVQRLAVSSVGLSDVAVHVAKLPADRSGALEIVLRVIESDVVAGRWSLPLAELTVGWNRVGLARCLGPDECSVEVELRWTGADPIALSLSVVHPDERAAARHGAGLGRVLALRTWRGLPNSSPPAAAATPAAEGQQARRWTVPAEVLAAAENLTSVPEHVGFNGELAALLVHPAGEEPTSARLRAACPTGTRHVWATVETTHPDAPVIDYALAVSPVSDRRPGRDIPAFGKGYVSEWIRVAGGERTAVHLFLPEALGEPGDLYLATRLRDSGNNAFCWAHFSDLGAST